MFTLLLASAVASDLDLDLDLDLVARGAAPMSMTFRDVAPGRLPALVFPVEGGEILRVEVTIARAFGRQVWLDPALHDDVTPGAVAVSTPRIVALVGEPAVVSAGAEGPGGEPRAPWELAPVYRR
jgi:hypothetical protein